MKDISYAFVLIQDRFYIPRPKNLVLLKTGNMLFALYNQG